MLGDRAEAQGTKPAPKGKPYVPPYKVGLGDVKTNVDRARAENYKSGRTAPSKGNPTYAQSIRAGYDAASPEDRKAQSTMAQARAELKGPKTFNGMDLRNSRESKIVLAEHARRVRQLQSAKAFKNPLNDISADMQVAKNYTGNYAPMARLQTGQTAFGPRRKSTVDTRLAASHPGIMTDSDRVVADVQKVIDKAMGDQTGRLPGDYSRMTKRFGSDLSEAAGGGRYDQHVKKTYDDGTGKLAMLDFVTNANNIASALGGVGRDAITSGLGAIDKLPIAGKIATSLVPGGAILPWLAKTGDIPGNAFKDAVDVYAQALPSLYQLGDAGVSAIGGDSKKLNEQWKGLKQIGEHPLQALHDHPLLVGMLAKGGVSAVGRTAGAGMRVAGTAATVAEDAGRIRQGIGAAAKAAGGEQLGRIASTQGRAPIKLPGTETPINRRYSHDVISKYVAQKPYDKFLGGQNRASKYAGKVNASVWEKRTGDELTGGGEAVRRLHRSAVNAFLTKTLPRHQAAKDLVPLIGERVVTNPGRLRSDLEQRLATLTAEEHNIPDGPGKINKVYDNRAQRARIEALLANEKLMAGGKWADQAFEAATEMAHKQNAVDEHLVTVGHVNQEQVDKAKGFTYAMEHMGAIHDETPRPTARKIMKDHLDEAERKAAQTAKVAKGKLDTAEQRVRAEQQNHKTIERRGKVPGGMERPLVLQRLDQELHATRTQLRKATNRVEHQSGKAGEATGSARVRSEQYDVRLLKSDPQYRKLRGNFSRTSQEKQAAQANWRNAHEGGRELHTDAERVAADQRLQEATQAHDTSHAHLHAYLDDVDAAAARGTRKVAGRSTSTSKAELHYHTKGRGPVGGLRRAERESGVLKLNRGQRAGLYAHERYLERQVKKGEREASKLKSSDHERLRLLAEKRDQLKAEHDQHLSDYEAVKAGNKMFGNIAKADESFVPGLTHPDGRQMTAAHIDAHMKEVGKIPGGLADTMWFTHRPGLSASAAGMVPGAQGAPQFEKLFSRTGAAAKAGTYDNSIEALAASMTRSQGILDAIGSRRRFVDTFVKPKGIAEDGTATWHRDADIAGKVARDYNTEHGYGNKDPRAMLPYQVTDARMDAARRNAQQAHFDPTADEAIARDHELALEPSLAANQTGPGHYGLVTRGALKRQREHEVAAQAGAGGFGEFTQKWRNAVLYGTSMPKWVTGNMAELVLRLAVAGAGPRSMYLGWKIMEETARQAGHPQEAAFLRAYLTGGGHFSGNVSRQINFAAKDQEGLRAGIQRVADAPTVRHLLMSWNSYKAFINHLNKKPELGGSYASIGKLALKDREAWQHLNGGWKDTMVMGDDAIAHVAKGLLETPEQLRYARHVYDTIGRYTNLSPRARRWVANYTPFGLWFANALKFGLLTIPRHHPLFGALLSASYLATQKDREQLGQSLWAGNLPDFLQGSLPFEGYGPAGSSSHNFTRYMPFGAFTDPGQTAAQNVLPQISDFTFGILGRNFTGNKQSLSDGSTVRLDDRLKYAVYVTLEGMLPFVSVGHQIAEKKGKPYMDDYLWSMKTKPGTQAKSYREAAAMVLAPGYGYKNTSGSTGPRSTGGIPGNAIPGMNIPDPTAGAIP